ncbi:MAG: hypothetical protein ACREE9_00545 [Stellaceae bacterium]
MQRIDFAGINRAALGHADLILARWLPGGRYEGAEYVVRNPKRPDRKPGSFKINLKTGAWADFAIQIKGRDLVSLAAYLFDLHQSEAAQRLAAMIGLAAFDC